MKILVIFLSVIFLFSAVVEYASAANVSILEGTNLQGCDEINQCYDPYLLVIDVGETVTWKNNDAVPHTITSGNPTDGPDGLFDSGLIQPGESFSLKFESSQITAYFDMVHPWMQGIVRVIEGGPDEEIPEPEIIIEEPPKMSQQESDVCSSSSLVSLMGPLHVINFKYTADSAKTFEKYKRSQGFEEYLLGIDYNKSEKVRNYVDSILASEEFAVFYFKRDLSPEEEKLMIQVSEKYLEYLYDGKNELTLLMRTNYSEKKNEINAIPMQDSRITICGDDKIEGLEELEKNRMNMQLAIELYLEPVIEDWEKNLEIKQKSASIESSDSFEETTKEKETESMNKIVSGDIGLKKGDWVKYKIILETEGEGFMSIMLEGMKSKFDIGETECSFNEMDWFKVEVSDIVNNKPVFKKSLSCNGKEIPADEFGSDDRSYYTPIDVNVGEVLDDGSEDPPKVIGSEERKYGNKNVQVIKSHSETRQIYDVGSLESSKTYYFDKNSGFLLENNFKMNSEGVPFVGDLYWDMGFVALDFNIPRQTQQIGGGGCLIATATYGSELAPQVQQLRELRDNKLLQTESGSAFMRGFNNLYYSFSPTIADFERENPLFKEGVKIAITPMISSLSILNHVDMNSESEVIGYGISLILLNVGMYVGVSAIVVIGIKKKF